MNCRQFEEDLWLYLYGETAPAQLEKADDHLSACEACRARVTEAEGLRALLAQREVPEPSRDLLVRARMDLDEALDREELSWRTWARNLVYGMPALYASRAFAAALVLAVGFGMGWMLGPSAPSPDPIQGPYPSMVDGSPVLSGRSGLQNYKVNSIRELVPDPVTGQVQVTMDAQGQVTLSGSLDNPQIQRVLLETVRSYENPGIRRDTVGVLRGHSSNQEVRETLIYAMLNDQNDGVRIEALDTVRTFDWSPEVRDAFVHVLRTDQNPGIRVAAVNILIRNADKKILPVLREFADGDDNAYVRMQCASAVRKLEAGEF